MPSIQGRTGTGLLKEDSAHFCEIREWKSGCKIHLFSKKKYLGLGAPCSPESRIIGQWSE